MLPNPEQHALPVMYLVNDVHAPFLMFQSCSHYPYLTFLQKTGLSVGPFQLRWYTTSLNRLVLKMSFWNPKLQTNWFTIGSWITICLIVPSVCLVIMSSAQLCKKIFTEPTNESAMSQQETFLEPVVSNPHNILVLFNIIIF